MNKLQIFRQFLTTPLTQLPVGQFILDFILAAILSFMLGWIYVRYGTTLSNRKIFARSFVLISMTTMFIITIVKSSLPLSLGLVGALSIVRFRAAIKEPEELSYLFLAVAIGLGVGAGQRLITSVSFVIISAIIALRGYSHRADDNKNLYLTVSSANPHKIGLEQIVEVLKRNCLKVNMKRFDENKETLEAAFLIEFDNFEQLNKTKSELQGLSDTITISCLDNKGII